MKYRIIIPAASAIFLVLFLQGRPYPLQSSTGAELFSKYCATCHQINGKGVRNMFPPLAGNAKITGPADSVITIVLFGLQGPITVNERDYNQPMPPQAYLKDDQIADILTYIRSSWGNNAPPVTAANVEKIRKKGNK